MKFYIVIKPDEDGFPYQIYDENGIKEVLEENKRHLPISWKEFLENPDSNYWKEDDWFIAKIIPVNIVPEEVITKLTIKEG